MGPKVPVFAGVTGSVATADVVKDSASLGAAEVVEGVGAVSATLAHLGSMSIVIVESFMRNTSPVDVTSLLWFFAVFLVSMV